ncbi:MAG: CBS domain-containing protein [Anaerolineaceae bacterium]|nr:CBS domain-containing protein [Anaerolineaceae bacterium]
MDRGFSIGHIFGINIRVDWSWLLIFVLVVWNLASVFGGVHPDWGPALSWGTALVAALLFFGSVLAHELAHSLVARARGIPVRGITLFLFGGVSNIQREPPSAGAEFIMAIVGPLTSVVLGAILVVIGVASAGPLPNAAAAPNQFLASLGPLTTLLLWLGTVNIVVGIFNMIPAFPLDGGRVLRSIFWALSNNLRKATRWASWIGQGIAWLMIVAGIAMVFGVQLPVLGTGPISGLWLAFIGWFLNSSASRSYQQVVVQDMLEDVPVRRLMRSNPPTVPPDITIDSLVHEYVMGTDDHSFPVVEGSHLLGMICLHDVRDVPRTEWDTTLVRDVMTPEGNLITVKPDEDAAEALHRLQQQDVRQLPVTTNGTLQGLVRRRDFVRWLQLESELEAQTR